MCASLFSLGLASNAYSALVLQNAGNEVLDTTTGLVWMNDFSLAPVANWSIQQNWAANLTFAGNSDWRLPSTVQARAIGQTYDLFSADEFINVGGSKWTDNYGNGAGGWRWSPNGGLTQISRAQPLGAVAIRDAIITDVAFTAIPVPATAWLFGSALTGLLVMRRKIS